MRGAVPANVLKLDARILGLKPNHGNMARLRRSMEVAVKEPKFTKENEDDYELEYKVSSQRNPEQYYTVLSKGNAKETKCSCPDSGKGNLCKHQLAVRKKEHDDFNTEVYGPDIYVVPFWGRF